MKNIFRTLLLSLIVLMLPTCSSDYLDTLPTESVGTPTVFESTENAKLAINGIAKLMTIQYLSSQGFNGEGTIKMYYGNYTGNNFVVALSSSANVINGLYHENATSIYDYYPWFYYYMLIGNANNVIVNIDEASGPENERSYIKAQALTYRAYGYMMLAQIYSYRWKDSNDGATNGLVLRTDISSGGMPLSTLKETYNQIYKDLDEAITLFKSSGIERKSTENYLPSLNVAYATYARAALNREDYPKASNNAVLAREGFPLMNVADYNDGFAKPTSEWIWSCYGASDETLYFYSYFAYIGYNSTASAVRSYPKMISRELYNTIPSSDIRHDLFLDPLNDKYTASTGLAATNSPLYKRAFLARPDLNSGAKVAAYMQFKVKNNDNPGVGNLNLFRSSEMYLIEAEAQNFLKNDTKAQDALNALNATTKRDPGFASTATGETLLKDIKKYRAIELWGEGFDWFDHKRWGDSIVRKENKDGGNFMGILAVTIKPEDNNKWTWRIPIKETDYNDGIGGK
ncbi:MAG: RagB/SusD family nutrient uptake outer membrane protein [Candidatus Saccharimonadaceae bacterium]